MDVLQEPVVAEQAVRPATAQTGRRRLRRDWLLVACALPGLGALVVFHYIPLLGHVIAFKDYQPYVGIADSPWVGLDNFKVIFTGDPAFLNALTNTLVISLLQLVFVFPLPIAVALLLNSLASERFNGIRLNFVTTPQTPDRETSHQVTDPVRPATVV